MTAYLATLRQALTINRWPVLTAEEQKRLNQAEKLERLYKKAK